MKLQSRWIASAATLALGLVTVGARLTGAAEPQESGMPITYFGSAWATLGLVRIVPPLLDLATRHKRALNMIVAINGRVERDEGLPDKPVPPASLGFGPYDDDLAQAAVHLTAFPQFKFVRMKFTKLTDAGVQALQQALSNAKVDRRPLSHTGMTAEKQQSETTKRIVTMTINLGGDRQPLPFENFDARVAGSVRQEFGSTHRRGLRPC